MNIASPWWLWLAWAAGGILSLVGLWLLYRSLLADRSRGRKRCPACWYDMTGTPTLTCPECGRTARSDRHLLRTRRRSARALAALLITFVGYCTLRTPALLAGRWTGLIPTSVLVLIAPADSPPPTAIPTLQGIPIVNGFFTQRPPKSPATLSEFRDRILTDLHAAVWERAQSGRAWRWQTSLYITRFLDSHGVDIATGAKIPTRWPAREPVPYLLRPPASLTGMLFGVRTPGGAWHWNTARQGEPFAPPAAGSAGLDVEFGIGVNTTPIILLWTRSVTLPITLGGDAAGFLTPVTSPEIDALVRRAIDPRLALDADGQISLIANDRGGGAPWTSINFSIGVHLELMADGLTLARTTSICSWARPVWKDWEDWRIEWSPTIDHLFTTDARGRKSLRPEVLAGATIRVRGDPVLAAKPYLEWPFDKPTTEFWAGSFEAPARFDEHPGKQQE